MMTLTPALLLEEDLPLELKGDLPPEILGLDEPAAKAVENVKAELTVTKDGDDILVVGWVRTTLKLQCGRCAEWLPWPIRTEFNHLFEAPHPNFLDMAPYIREDILLELPLNAVCRLSAEGRCSVTGEIYQPAPETSAPLANEAIWEALSKIKLKE